MKSLCATLLLCIIQTSRTLAANFIELPAEFRYVARLSNQDHRRNSDNANLAAVPGIKPQDILLQDRLNFHQFGKRDKEDTDDGMFGELGPSGFETLFDTLRFSTVPQDIGQEILKGTPLIEVSFSRSYGIIARKLPFESKIKTVGSTSPPPISSANSQQNVLLSPSFGISFNFSKLGIGTLIALATALAGTAVRSQMGSHISNHTAINSKIVRAGVFLLVSMLVMFRADVVIKFIEVQNHPWWLPLGIAIISGGTIALFPNTSLFTLIAVPVIALLAIAGFEYVTILCIFALLAVAVAVLPFAAYLASVYFLLNFGFNMWGYQGASICVLFWLTAFFMTWRFALEMTKQSFEGILSFARVTAETVFSYFSTWPLAKMLCSTASALGHSLGGDFFSSSNS